MTSATGASAAGSRAGGVRLHGRLVADGADLADGVVVVQEGRVAFAGPAGALPAELTDVPTPDGWRRDLVLMPGLVDIHCHGAAGGEFGAGLDDARLAARHHLAHGTTTLVGSIASRVPDDLVHAVAEVAALTAEGVLAGVHLEGPFLSDARRGAQNPAALSDVDAALVHRAVAAAAASGAPILHMTYAPERDPSAELPSLLADHGVVADIGHTDAAASLVATALAGVRRVAPRGGRPLVTHLFNGMPPLHHRSPGPVAAALAAAGRGDAVVELIGDGVHLAPETVRMVFETVGPSSIALVTDAMAACGMPDGHYRLGRLDVSVTDGTARLTDGGSIAGGTATLLDVVRWTATTAGVALADAVLAATATPADALALPAGRLRPGDPADLVVASSDLELVLVLRDGRVVTLDPGAGDAEV
ncbi:MAG: amidohydrolase family protein [Nocardioidaceae bacterium]|nr:amidohydrolase family protein [Nocardioidaceae bacterium]